MTNDIHVDVKGQSEDALQQKCVFWFWNEYPELRKLLFSVPNGGLRDKREAKKLKQTGLTSGVSDLLLLYDSNCYCIELKAEGGTQSYAQVDWEAKVRAHGFQYFIIDSLSKFKELIRVIV